MSVAQLSRQLTKLEKQTGMAAKAPIARLQGVDAEGNVTGTYTLDGEETEPGEDTIIFQIVDPMIKVLLSRKRYGVLSSGRSAGKSHGAARWVLAAAMSDSIRILVGREALISLEQSMYALLEDIILESSELSKIFKIEKKITCTTTGSEIIFKGLRRDRVEASIKSIEGIDLAVIEESQTISRVSLRILRPSIRNESSRIIFLLNPRYPDDAVYEDFIKTDRDDTEVVHFTHEVNYWNPEVMTEEAAIDYRNNPAEYLHTWGGELAQNADEQIFSNWIVEDIDIEEVKNELKASFRVKQYRSAHDLKEQKGRAYNKIDNAFRVGFDHGWVHASAGIEIYVDKKHKRVFVLRELYEKHLRLDRIGLSLKEAIPRAAEKWPVEADSARPDVIDFLRQEGINAHPGMKYQVRERITTLQTWLIIVDSSCRNTINELSTYRWKKDRNDRLLPDPVKANDDLLDALSYAMGKDLEPRPVATYQKLKDPYL
ncbi:MAG: PBSX family phage terminase large subunit [Spirochaetaceae bacterium]|nr:PBSX family phage terminase large subunit [Spirochaetia bacterium]MCF7951886.1 PBSX family phage terminase large subunit [Spirochaetaceae bacterium]